MDPIFVNWSSLHDLVGSYLSIKGGQEIGFFGKKPGFPSRFPSAEYLSVTIYWSFPVR